MKIKCKSCGEYFYLSKEDQELFTEGFVAICELPKYCEECSDYIQVPTPDEEMIDHDPGL